MPDGDHNKSSKQSPEDIEEYSGLNRVFRSRAVQFILNKLDDGTFREFFDDWKWIFHFSKKYKRIIIFYTILGIASTSLSLVSSVASKYMIDIITGYEFSKLGLLALLMIGSTVISLVFSSLVSRISARISISVNNDIQAGIFDQILDADWLSLSRFQNGDILNRFNSDVSTVASNAVSWFPNLIIALYNFIATFCVIFYYDATMAWIALSSAPFLLIASRFLMRKNKEYRKKTLEVNSRLMSFETESFYNMDTIKSFGVMGHYGGKLRILQEEYKACNLDYNLFSIKTNVGLSLLGTVVSLVSFAYCLFRLWTGDITYGTMTLFLTQRSRLSSQFDTLVGIIPGMLNSSVSAHRIRELTALPREKHGDAAYAGIKGGITVKMHDVDFAYAGDQKVLRDSDFIARPNEIVALVGPSGEGKTTLIRMLLGLIYPDPSGTDGHPNQGVTLTDPSGKEIPVNADTRMYFAYVPQGNTILSGTVAENLRMVKEDATDDEITAALKTACAWEFVSKLDGGIDGRLGERGRGLSEGQAQRIAIARAVLRDAPVLLLDEATSALDVETERKVLKNIIKKQPDKTVIVTTHRPSVLDMCQRVYRVQDGKLSELDEKASQKMVMDF